MTPASLLEVTDPAVATYSIEKPVNNVDARFRTLPEAPSKRLELLRSVIEPEIEEGLCGRLGLKGRR